jgi:hypothetical protein
MTDLSCFPDGVREFLSRRLSSLDFLSKADLSGLTLGQSPIFQLSAVINSFQSRLTDVTLFRVALEVFGKMFRDTSAGAHQRLARFLSLCSPLSAYWHLVLPSSPEFMFSSEVFRAMLAYHLELPLQCVQSLPEICECGTHVDAFGYHIIECQRIPIHDGLLRELFACIRAAGAVPQLEPRNALSRGPLRARPDLAIRFLDLSGKVVLVDLTTGSPTSSSYVLGSARCPGFTADAIEARKARQYRDCFDPSRELFYALGIEIPGRWGRRFTAFFAKLCSKAKDHLGDSDNSFGSYWKRRLSSSFRTLMFERGLALVRRVALSNISNVSQVFSLDAIL